MGGYPEGAPCWADVSLSDVAAGRRFYGELLGWTFDEESDDQRYGQYTNAYREGRRVAALQSKRDGRMPTTWTVYFAAPDVRALTARVRAAGGQVITDPMPVPPHGTMAVAADPGGAVFGLWQGEAHAGFERTREPGSFCWTEVYTRDKDQADAFYESVFGYLGASPGSADELGADMRTWSLPGTEPGPGTAVAARALMSPAFPAALPDHFLVYFLVGDCDATADACTRLGGRVTAAPFDIQYGRMAVLNDNQGATFAVLQGADT
ncbi:VOC family protein [Streptomyces sp. NBC_00083]|uniref:VOC family protein n=1 Tax=Streptomyces sp. NBC_00083 TaxID=2975647 RepID=UPI00224E0165|nr:VOC family protein [Streptomyces sp. NBC_00083]MCX5381835.1 VOC family protein [Streptomyces sp. NBC_00083]